jgi:hypothetical protein
MLSGGVGFAAARQGKLVLALPPNREIPRPTRGILPADFLYLQAGGRGPIVASLLSTVRSTILP